MKVRSSSSLSAQKRTLSDTQRYVELAGAHHSWVDRVQDCAAAATPT